MKKTGDLGKIKLGFGPHHPLESMPYSNVTMKKDFQKSSKWAQCVPKVKFSYHTFKMYLHAKKTSYMHQMCN